MHNRIFFSICLIVCSFSGIAQGVKISATGTSPNPSAMLEVESTSKGFLLPRMTTTQRNAIPNPAVGLQVYNTTTNCVDTYFPGGWKPTGCDCQSFPSANFTTSGSLSINTNITFTPASAGTYAWSFTNGSISSSTSAAPVVSWSTAGTYSVQLTVTDNNNCSSTSTQNITISSCVTGGTQTFTSCGQSGPNGPTQTQCNNTYGSSVVTVNGANQGIQLWTVPVGVCSITIEAWGAQGGGRNDYPGGLGAYQKGTFSVNGGDVLKIVVGQRGNFTSANLCDGGGGGGSFVFTSSNQLLIAAGGGGGSSDVNPGLSAGVSQAGTNGQQISTQMAYPAGLGGTAGAGGAGGFFSGGGAGVLSNGGNGTGSSGYAQGGQSLANNFVGGASQQSISGGEGGFGGGGGGLNNCHGGGGGGGGYSGGGAGSHFGAGGGGGSFNSGTNQAQTGAARSGNGQIIITW